MKRREYHGTSWFTRRDFFGSAVASVSVPLLSAGFAATALGVPDTAADARLVFASEGNQYRFNTGSLRGSLRPQGKSLGLGPVVDVTTGTSLAQPYGLLSHYRLLDAESRYGHAAWDWSSQSRLLSDGSVEVFWSADRAHPFDMKALYRWTAPNMLDVTTTVIPRRAVRGFEVFLACYFEGFATSLVYVKGCPETEGKRSFFEAKKSHGVWQMFPRDDEAVKLIGDGRWGRPPHPVNWKIMPQLAAPLGMRRDLATGLAALVLAPPQDCFAVSTPFGEDSHRSLYFSLLGRDLKAGQSATARSRLIIGRGISDERAVKYYENYLNNIQYIQKLNE